MAEEHPTDGSASGRHRAAIDEGRARVAAGQRPVYHVLLATSNDGSVDVTVRELPLIHLYVPDDAGALDGARFLIARTLSIDPSSLDLAEGTASTG